MKPRAAQTPVLTLASGGLFGLSSAIYRGGIMSVSQLDRWVEAQGFSAMSSKFGSERSFAS